MISIFGDTLFNKYKIVIIPQDYLTNELIYGTFYMDVINTALVILILYTLCTPILLPSNENINDIVNIVNTYIR